MKNSRQLIIDTATDLFSTERYGNVSIAAICRKAGIANSVYYYYFKDKEELYKEILEYLFNRLDEAFGRIEGDSEADRINCFISILETCNILYSREIEVYREGEFHFPEYDHALKAIYHSSLEMVYRRPLSHAEYLYFTAGVRFVALRYTPEEMVRKREALLSFISNGIFDDCFSLTSGDFTEVPRFSETFIENSRDKMIRSGLKLIGEQGFDRAQIFDISRNAGYSVGMFYKNFRDKISFLHELVDRLNFSLKESQEKYRPSFASGADEGLFYLYIEISFFKDNPHYFNLLREASFAVPERFRLFYDRLEQDFIERGNTSGNPDTSLAVSFLLGIGYFLEGEILFREDAPPLIPLLLELGALLDHGIPARSVSQ
ncbi:MAG: TetR/AcrR family transcriptional regulator [Spirochaetales bacterium]|nr:TetR/AcrR family transcriptional regulator [Spirochaetales bacterium]